MNVTSPKIAKTPKPSKKKTKAARNGDVPSSENRRRSGRMNIAGKSYAEDDDDEQVDDDEIIWRYENEDGETVETEEAALPIHDDNNNNDDDNNAASGHDDSSELSQVDEGGSSGGLLQNGKKQHDHNDMEVDNNNAHDNHDADDAATNQLLSEANSIGARGAGDEFDLPRSPSPYASSAKKPGSTLKRTSITGRDKGKGNEKAKKSLPLSSSSPPPTSKRGVNARTKSSAKSHPMANIRARGRAEA